MSGDGEDARWTGSGVVLRNGGTLAATSPGGGGAAARLICDTICSHRSSVAVLSWRAMSIAFNETEAMSTGIVFIDRSPSLNRSAAVEEVLNLFVAAPQRKESAEKAMDFVGAVEATAVIAIPPGEHVG